MTGPAGSAAPERRVSGILEEVLSRIARLEARVAELDGGAASRPAGAIDPGDAVPPGVAVQAPGPLDGEAKAARKSLEKRLAKDKKRR